MNIRIIGISLTAVTLLLAACDGDSRPFSEAVEVGTLNLESIEVLPPANSLDDIYLNINQGLQLSLLGNQVAGNSVPLAADNRQWSVSNSAVASVTENGYLIARSNGTVDVSVTIGGIASARFGVTVANAELSVINAIGGVATLERCIPQTYTATGTFSDGTNRTLENVTWSVNDPSNARLFDSNGQSTQLNALAAMDQLTLTATAPGGQVLAQPLIVSDNLTDIQINPTPITLDVDEERNVTAIGVYSVSTEGVAVVTKIQNITDNVNWTVVTGTSNLSIDNVRGTKGLLTGADEGDAEIIAACGLTFDRKPVVVNEEGTSTATTLAFRIGNTQVVGNQITLSLVANSGSIPLRASTGSEYDADNDVTSDVDFQLQASTSSLTPPFVIDGNGTATPSIRLNAIGTSTIEATETTEGEVSEIITITVTN